jgi:hypothetical protein
VMLLLVFIWFYAGYQIISLIINFESWPDSRIDPQLLQGFCLSLFR